MSRDPRIKWSDGQWAIVNCADIPEGVPRGVGYPKVVELIEHVESPAFSFYPYSTGPGLAKYWSVVKLSALGWSNADRAQTPTKAVPDWPLACPKCQRENSAVLLAQNWDCKHGCFGRYR